MVGALNTLITYFIYISALLFLNYSVSYSIAFFAGILVSFYLNTKFVFQQKITLIKFIQFPFVYIVQYILGFTLLQIAVQKLAIPEMIAPIIVLLFSLPINFFLTRLILKRRQAKNNI